MMTVAFVRILIALGLGLAIGLERTFAHKTAGMRTYGLVAMGSSLFVILSELVVSGSNLYSFDPMRTAAAIIMGIGFLCGGVIIFQNHQLSGLTTAAGLWLTAGVGMAVGFGQISLAVFTTVVTLLVFTALWFVEQMIARKNK
ncbi:MgtC/SapB family protein [Candidatus Parcubacteria bacterium]|nr:MgtC/SapB family protein [Candidatus Parcubacteria bacterium]